MEKLTATNKAKNNFVLTKNKKEERKNNINKKENLRLIANTNQSVLSQVAGIATWSSYQF